jgi:hypothetical protein
MRMTDKQLGDSHLRADSHLDAAIDRAVREMMSVEPRADLRQRVLAELVEEPTRATLWPRLAFGSAALALLIVFMFVFARRPVDRGGEPTIVQSQPPASVPGNPRGATGPAAETAPKSAGRESRGTDRLPTRAVARSRRPGAEDRQIQAASIDTGEAIAIEPLTPVESLTTIDPIGIAKLDTPQASTSEIALKPITIEPIEITPLTPPR